MRVRYDGPEQAVVPNSGLWQPGEIRELSDDEAARIGRNVWFAAVVEAPAKQVKGKSDAADSTVR